VVRTLVLLFCLRGYGPIWAQSATSLQQVKRVFVGSFGGSAEAQEIRQSLIEELRKHGKFGVADSAAESDAALTGSGGVYIKGYFSLNPRARTIGEDAHPVYGGYFSVELKGAQNEVLWSYLVTPRRFARLEPIGHNLAVQVVKKLREALPR
jgi:hypothetical protein